jgi:trehalose synthase
MIKTIEVKEGVQLKDYDLYSSLAMPLRELIQEAKLILPKIKNTKIWMVNSTAQGGGVAEMLPAPTEKIFLTLQKKSTIRSMENKARH